MCPISVFIVPETMPAYVAVNRNTLIHHMSDFVSYF